MELNVKYLKAAVIVASKEETRYYLKGVAVQAGDKGAFIVATDGHRALAFRQSAEAQAPVDIIIPADIIAGIKPGKYDERAELTQESANRWRIDYCGTSIVFSPIDGTFPEWRRIVPKEISGETAQFNPSYVGDFAKVAKALAAKGDCVKIAQNGQGPALVTFGDEIDGFGLLMPTRANQASTVWDSAPSWATV
jgi:DNA polymerase III sliding clamp (beta) subunit (PCNA family)